jgi:hypothetical protein
LNRATVAQRTCSRHSTRRDGLEEDQADLCPRGRNGLIRLMGREAVGGGVFSKFGRQ